MEPVDVSVIIPTYHREQQLLEAVNSVRSQQGVTLEIIVVDDSAEASARDVVASLSDPRVRYMARPVPSKGRPAHVRNDGAKVAQGRYFYFLDDDDLLEEGTLATMTQALDAAPNAGMAFGVIAPFGLDAGVLRHHQQYFQEARRIALKLKGRRQLSAYLTFRAAVLVCSAGMARRSAFTEAGGFDPDIPVCEDAELWARIARARGHVFIDKTVVRYRTGAPSLMHNLAANDEKLRVSSRRIQDKYRRANGLMEFFAMKLWARAIFR
jgi:glycosyltransferase involved in cell wall biosynthesis